MNQSSESVVQNSGSLTVAMLGGEIWSPVDVDSVAGGDITVVAEGRVRAEVAVAEVSGHQFEAY